MDASTQPDRNHHSHSPESGSAGGSASDAGAAIGPGHEHEPLAHYVALMAGFASLSALTLGALHAAGRPFPTQVGLHDVALLGLATSRVSRLVTHDKVMRAVRAPFTEVVPGTSPDKVNERPRRVDGGRRAIGELLTCPRCVGMWAALGLSCGYVLSPKVTRVIATIFAAATLSDFVNSKLADRA